MSEASVSDLPTYASDTDAVQIKEENESYENTKSPQSYSQSPQQSSPHIKDEETSQMNDQNEQNEENDQNEQNENNDELNMKEGNEENYEISTNKEEYPDENIKSQSPSQQTSDSIHAEMDANLEEQMYSENFNPESLVSTTTDPTSIEIPPITWNIFVGDLTADVTEEDLTSAFSGAGEIQAVNVIRNTSSGQCKGFAFIHFMSREAQETAMKPPYAGCVIKGRPCRVKASEHKDTLFIGNVPNEFNQEQILACMRELCKNITDDISVILKTGPPPTFRSRGFCFVKFGSHVHADAAKKILNNASVGGRPLNVSWAETDCREIDNLAMEKVRTLYVSNVSASVHEDILRCLFAQFGNIVKCVIVKHASTGEPRGFAFVEFANRDDCLDALRVLDGSEFFQQRLAIVLAKPPPDEGGTTGGKIKRSKSSKSRAGSKYAINRATGEYVQVNPQQFQSLKRGQQGWPGWTQNEGWSQAAGWNQAGGWNQGAWTQGGWNQAGWNQGGWNQGGWNQDWSQANWNQANWNQYQGNWNQNWGNNY